MKHLTSTLALICVALTVISFPITAQTPGLSANTRNNITSAGAQFNLGVSCYEKKDYSEAIKWFKKAAEQGNVSAQYMLGICYKNGFGEYGEAMKWFRTAAEKGNAEAQYELGYCYEYRLGDKKEASYWYRKAIENGYTKGNKPILATDNDSISAEAREIDIVIDKLNGMEDPGEDLSKKEILDAIQDIVSQMKKIDTRRCPEDFRIAYEHYIQAAEYSYVAYLGVPEGFWDTLFSGDEYKNKLQDAMDRILKAEGEVNESAARHGAKKRVE